MLFYEFMDVSCATSVINFCSLCVNLGKTKCLETCTTGSQYEASAVGEFDICVNQDVPVRRNRC